MTVPVTNDAAPRRRPDFCDGLRKKKLSDSTEVYITPKPGAAGDLRIRVGMQPELGTGKENPREHSQIHPESVVFSELGLAISLNS